MLAILGSILNPFKYPLGESFWLAFRIGDKEQECRVGGVRKILQKNNFQGKISVNFRIKSLKFTNPHYWNPHLHQPLQEANRLAYYNTPEKSIIKSHRFCQVMFRLQRKGIRGSE